MTREERQLHQLVKYRLGVFTNGARFSDNQMGITLNLPDGDKKTIWGEWRHMSKVGRLTDRVTMLQHAIYEEYPEYRNRIPQEWAR